MCSSDLRFDHSGPRVEVVVPDVLHDHRLRNDPTGITQEVFQQRELFWLQFNLNALSEDLSPYQVHFEITGGECSWFTRSGGPPYERMNARH